MRLTRSQAKAHRVLRAKGIRHRAQLVGYSEAGVSKQSAAEAIGLTLEGVNSLLYREFKSQAWPIAGHGPK